MKKLSLKITSLILAAIVGAGTLVFTPKANGAAAAIGTAAYLAGELIGKVVEWPGDGSELVQLIALVTNTQAQIDAMKDKFEQDSERFAEWKKGLEDLKELKSALTKSRHAYYAAQDVSTFYRGLWDYWNYAKEKGFSNYSRTLSTISQGINLAKQVTRDAISVAFLVDGKDENGNKAELEAEDMSSRIQTCFDSIRDCFDAWALLVKSDGVMSAGQEVDSSLYEQMTDPNNGLNICSFGRNFGKRRVNNIGKVEIESHNVIK